MPDTKKQLIREFSYSFVTSGKLTSYVVSQNAPGLASTAYYLGGTALYVDNIELRKDW